MLFDLRGRRRRAVQVTYAGLALLMGVGLVGAGVGSDVSGGVFDIFTGDDGGDADDANKPAKKRVERANEKLKTNPRDQAALTDLIRGHYALGTADADPKDGTFGEDGKKELRKASDAWKRLLALKPEKVDPSLAELMRTAVYGPTGLNDPGNATEAAELVAEARNDISSYVQFAQLAYQAGQTRKGDLAGEKALELATSKEEREQVKALLEQAKAPPQQDDQGGAQPPAGGGAHPPAGGGSEPPAGGGG
jgi:hypothetical protein